MSGYHKKDKFGQVMQNFFLKTANVIHQSRNDSEISGPLGASSTKTNKWFNLETQDSPREELKQWKSSPQQLLPLVVETYLDLRELNTKQSLVLKDEDGTSWTVNTKKTEIVLERWLIELDKSEASDDNNELPSLYKKLIVTIRYIYTLSRLLPSYKLMKRLSRVKLTKSPLAIRTRVLDGSRPIVSKGRIGLSKNIIISSSDHLVQKKVTPVITSAGSLRVSVSYRKQINFELNDSEETLSNHFLHIDKTRTASSSSGPPSSSLRKAFKSGNTMAPNTVAGPPPGTSPLAKNDSSSSITTTLKFQRSGSTGAAAPIAVNPISVPKSVSSSMSSTHNPVNDLSSSGSTPKYSSSFGKVVRRSSLRRSSTSTPTSFEPRTTVSSDEDLNEFVKMLDNRVELQLSYSPNVQDSLTKFQLMKGKNELLGESLSKSVRFSSASPPPVAIGSHSRNYSKSPPSAFGSYKLSPLNPSKMYETGSTSGNSSESLPHLADSNGFASRFGSASPASVLKRNIGPSNPTIASTNTHAKMYRNIHSASESAVAVAAPASDYHDEEDDLLFTMSDMNVPR